MPRANRHFLPGLVWHITHRCHDRRFLLKAARDRDTWRRWLFTAKSRHALSVLNFAVTSNHVHLLVHDTLGDDAIPRSMQLLGGRMAQVYNGRRGRRGAFWEDRYHAVAVESGEHLWRCLTYIDLNMVRAGVVRHPRDWPHGGYNEIQSSRSRYRVIDLDGLASLTDCTSVAQLQAAHREQVELSVQADDHARDPCWTESIAVGSEAFAEAVRLRLGLSRLDRVIRRADGAYMLREARGRYVGIVRSERAR